MTRLLGTTSIAMRAGVAGVSARYDSAICGMTGAPTCCGPAVCCAADLLVRCGPIPFRLAVCRGSFFCISAGYADSAGTADSEGLGGSRFLAGSTSSPGATGDRELIAAGGCELTAYR